MVWPMVAAMAVSAVAGYASSKSQQASGESQNDSQRLWNQYNAQQQFNVTAGNIAAQQTIARGNAAMIRSAADSSIMINEARTVFNAGQLTEAALYNDALYEDELAMIWEQNELDLALLGKIRARERGEMVADQSVSGTTIGEDSNADMIIEQKTMEALDATVVKYNADVNAKRVSDARARSLWDAENELNALQFEGKMFNIGTTVNAAMQSAGILMESAIGAAADTKSAQYALTSGMAWADMNYSQNDSKIQSNFRSGIYNTIGSTVSSGFSMAGTGVSTTGSGNSLTQIGNSSSFGSNFAGSSLMNSGSGMTFGGR